MSRIAKWRRGPGDPATARDWLVRGERSLESAPPLDRRRLLVIGGILALYLPLELGLFFVFPNGVRYAFLPNFVWPVFNLWSSQRRKRALFEAEPESFKVSLAVSAPNTLTTGRDRGRLIFCDGWLLFEGRRTEFAVTRGEATGRWEQNGLGLRLEDGRTASFALPEGANVEPLRKAHALWQATAPPEGEAVLPPLEVHPEVWVGRWTFCLLGAALMAVPSIVGALLGAWLVAGLSLAAVFLCSAFAVLYARRLREELPRVLPNPVSASLEGRETAPAP